MKAAVSGGGGGRVDQRRASATGLSAGRRPSPAPTCARPSDRRRGGLANAVGADSAQVAAAAKVVAEVVVPRDQLGQSAAAAAKATSARKEQQVAVVVAAHKERLREWREESSRAPKRGTRDEPRTKEDRPRDSTTWVPDHQSGAGPCGRYSSASLSVSRRRRLSLLGAGLRPRRRPASGTIADDDGEHAGQHRSAPHDDNNSLIL
jgi:hypothetical protein